MYSSHLELQLQPVISRLAHSAVQLVARSWFQSLQTGSSVESVGVTLLVSHQPPALTETVTSSHSGDN